jgi:hypothetical protein
MWPRSIWTSLLYEHEALWQLRMKPPSTASQLCSHDLDRSIHDTELVLSWPLCCRDLSPLQLYACVLEPDHCRSMKTLSIELLAIVSGIALELLLARLGEQLDTMKLFTSLI